MLIQVFSLTVIFGLYHGLVLLPVLLFILGPDKEEETDKVQNGGQGGTNNNYGTRGHDNLMFVQEVNLLICICMLYILFKYLI